MLQCLLRQGSGVYNLAGDGAVRWSDMARSLGRRLIRLPAPVLYGLTGAAWALRLQSDSPTRGIDLIRYPWNVSTEKIERELGVQLIYSSEGAWNAFAQLGRSPASVS